MKWDKDQNFLCIVQIILSLPLALGGGAHQKTKSNYFARGMYTEFAGGMGLVIFTEIPGSFISGQGVV